MYTINPTTGALTSIGSQVTAGFCANSVTVDPFGKFAYVANEGCGDTGGSVSMYAINPTSGALTSMIDAPCAAGSCLAPVSVAVHPSGKFAYVANEGGFAPTSVSMYSINATTGALAFTGTIAAAGRVLAVAVDPSGKFAYVVDGSDGFPGENGKVSMYTINATTGVLTSIGTIGTGLSPTSITIDPSGKFAYVANSGSNDISMYTINTTTGALTSMGPIAVGAPPGLIAIDPSEKFAYASNSIYSINATTGTLSPIGTIPANFPTPVAFHPSGKFAYAPGPGSNVSMYSIDAATGALTLIGTIGT
jgi:6-phosphogluconolactonase